MNAWSEVVAVNGEAIHEALACVASAGPVGALTIGAGRSASKRPVSFPPSGLLQVPLRGAAGEWLPACDGEALAITVGRRVTLIWALASRAARRAVATRVAGEVGARRAERVMASCERQAARPERERQSVVA